MKLEVGAGRKPFSLDAEWEHMDSLPLPHIEIVGDIRHIPRPDETYEEVYSHWVMEHFHRKEIPRVIREWKRVLKPGGKIVVVTYNTEAVIKALAEGILNWQDWNDLTFNLTRAMDFGDEFVPGSEHEIKMEEMHKIGFSPAYLRSFFDNEGMTTSLTTVQQSCRNPETGALNCPGIILEAVKP